MTSSPAEYGNRNEDIKVTMTSVVGYEQAREERGRRERERDWSVVRVNDKAT
jgi:hypothetical protein